MGAALAGEGRHPMNASVLQRLTIATRLTAINVLLVAAIVVVSVMAWQCLDMQNKAALAVSRIDVMQRHHQDADMYHDTIRADVYAALIAPHLSHHTPAQLRTNLSDDIKAFRAALDGSKDVNVSTELRVADLKLRALAEDYVTTAQISFDASLRDPAEGAAALPRFEVIFETVRVAMAAQTARYIEQMATAQGAAHNTRATARAWIVTTGIGVSVLIALLGSLVAGSIRHSLQRVGDTARAMAKGNLDLRNHATGRDEVGHLARALDAMADNLQNMLQQMRSANERGVFGNQLIEALEMADTESEAHGVVAQAMSVISSEHPMELLLADSSRAHLERATEHPLVGAPGCDVQSPFSCVAVRRGNPVVFNDSNALNACQRLRGRAAGAVSAVCVPVSFMGRSLGVLHATGPAGMPLADELVTRVSTLGNQAGARIGTVRAFERTQMQASTDSLTGLMNRRTLDDKVHELIAERQAFAVVLADLDRFKRLNDTLGHLVGDQALRQFAEVARLAARETDLVARWGGEEFVIVLPKSDAAQGCEWVERLRLRLAETQARLASTVVTASFGIADSSMASSFDQMLRIADAALYRAKDAGRDRAVIGEADMLAQGAHRHATEHDAQVNLRLLNADCG